MEKTFSQKAAFMYAALMGEATNISHEHGKEIAENFYKAVEELNQESLVRLYDIIRKV